MNGGPLNPKTKFAFQKKKITAESTSFQDPYILCKISEKINKEKT